MNKFLVVMGLSIFFSVLGAEAALLFLSLIMWEDLFALELADWTWHARAGFLVWATLVAAVVEQSYDRTHSKKVAKKEE